MTQVTEVLATIRDWQKRCSYFFIHSNHDPIFALTEKTFQTMTVLLSDGTDRRNILCDLIILDAQRVIAKDCERTDSSNELRTVIFGIIHSFQLTSIYLTDKLIETGNEASNATLTTVKELKEKCSEFSSNSKDVLLSLFSKWFDTVVVILCKDSVSKEVLYSLRILDSHRSITMEFDDSKSDPLRIISYGLIQSLYHTFCHLYEKLNTISIPEESHITEIIVLYDDDTVHRVKAEDSRIDSHVADYPLLALIPDASPEKDMHSDDIRRPEGEVEPRIETNIQENSTTISEEKEEEEAVPSNHDGEAGQARKRPRLDADSPDPDWILNENGSTTTKKSAMIDNETDLECVEAGCNYLTRSVNAWINHMKNAHDTTPFLAGVELHCKCGHRSISQRHSLYPSCKSPSFTIVRKRDEPIRRRSQQKTTPRCVEDDCNNFPATAKGYLRHLRTHHQKAPSVYGVYVKCSCGDEYRTEHEMTARTHNKDCDGRHYTLHKVEEQ
ncbi:hypothetical protein PENTCL1PPCAC_7633 [Pristionchus entomophagus]|uniref:C2H2-type domain-containing protein n=1 Tax=Pristionchus entomophagus TaxID=358040 RepID=A0AAV5SQN8_9BILA|nr:hypothetical protein PENTCL1PPCAC_7633 [Pristionchus entomophagus]